MRCRARSFTTISFSSALPGWSPTLLWFPPPWNQQPSPGSCCCICCRSLLWAAGHALSASDTSTAASTAAPKIFFFIIVLLHWGSALLFSAIIRAFIISPGCVLPHISQCRSLSETDRLLGRFTYNSVSRDFFRILLLDSFRTLFRTLFFRIFLPYSLITPSGHTLGYLLISCTMMTRSTAVIIIRSSNVVSVTDGDISSPPPPVNPAMAEPRIVVTDIAAPTNRDGFASGSRTLTLICYVDAPMDLAASMTPASTSFREDSTIRARGGCGNNQRTNGCALSPMVLGLTIRLVMGSTMISRMIKGTERSRLMMRPRTLLITGTGLMPLLVRHHQGDSPGNADYIR